MASYSFGKPFSFDTENKEYAAALASVFGPRFRRTMHNIGEGAWIGGKSWLYPSRTVRQPGLHVRPHNTKGGNHP